MLMNETLREGSAQKQASTPKPMAVVSLLSLLCFLLFSTTSIITSAHGAKVYHCLQSNGTKAYQGRPCEKDKKTVAVTEQKIQREEPTTPEQQFSVIGKWTLKGISSSPDGELQTQPQTIAWVFGASGKVTYQYEDTSAVYDYTVEGKKINIPDSPNVLFEIIKNQGDTAVWKTGSTYYFLTLSSII